MILIDGYDIFVIVTLFLAVVGSCYSSYLVRKIQRDRIEESRAYEEMRDDLEEQVRKIRHNAQQQTIAVKNILVEF